MCFRFRSIRIALWITVALNAPGAQRDVLRVCADPNNLPFSNQHGEGFENRLAELIARDFGARLEYTWWSQRRAFVRNSLGQGRCDVLMGVPSALNSVEVTRPYYRSTYVFVTRKDRHLRVTSLEDPRIGSWRVGIHMVGEDYAPPGVALGRRGLAANVVGFRLYGKYGEENPPARLIHAVADGNVDLAIVWGPFAGFFAPRELQALELAPVSPTTTLGVPFTFAISMAVRKGDRELKADLEGALERHCDSVRSLLAEYGVPQIPSGREECLCGSSRPSPASFWR
jgi:quinoprotein dehydrogenase-associated probable ABC transporter substrate-binding protein